MTDLTPQAQALLTTFAVRPDVSAQQAANLQALVTASPALVAQFNEATTPPAYLNAIVPLTNPHAGGEYNWPDREVRVPLSILNTPPGGRFDPGEATYVLGHELRHGGNRAEYNPRERAVYAQMDRIAQTPAPRDYTEPVENLLKARRLDESEAEVYGFNAVVSSVRQANPAATLADVYNANTRMPAYIDRSADGPPYTYAIKPPLTLNADLTLTPNDANVEGMGVHFFDRARAAPYGLGNQGDADYRHIYVGAAIADAAHYEHQRHPAGPGAGGPDMQLNLARLQVTEAGLERAGLRLTAGQTLPYLDSSTAPPTRHQFDYIAPAAAPAPPAPAPAVHPPAGAPAEAQPPRDAAAVVGGAAAGAAAGAAVGGAVAGAVAGTAAGAAVGAAAADASVQIGAGAPAPAGAAPGAPANNAPANAPGAQPPAVQPPTAANPTIPGLPPDHPDHARYREIRAGVERVDAQLGRSYDETSERLTTHALARHKERPDGGGPVDHVVMAKDGSTLFLVSGRLDDPAHQRTAVNVADAMNATPADSLRRAEAAPAPAPETAQDKSQESARAPGR